MRLRSGLTVYPASDRTPLKVIKAEKGVVTVGGPLVVFDDPAAPVKDLAGEYFTPDTYFGGGLARGDVDYIETTYNHGFVKDAALEPLTEHEFEPLKVTRTDTALMAELILDEADEYEKLLAGLAKKNKLGWSSGSATHRIKTEDDGQIVRWPLVEGALTPRPCEPRAKASALKSLSLDAWAQRFGASYGSALKAIGVDESYTAFIERVRDGLRATFSGPNDYIWAVEVYADRAVVESSGAYYEVGFEDTEDGLVFDARPSWTEVERKVSYVPAKALDDLNELFRQGGGAYRSAPDDPTSVLAEINRLLAS